jgi:auxin-responsive protein IAA
VEEPVIGGDYTLVYEDDEGDRVLVGDVPWE